MWILIQTLAQVTNSGKMDADHVVLGMLKPPGAGTNGVPLQTLWGFERVHVKAGQTVTVEMYPSISEFTQVDVAGARRALSRRAAADKWSTWPTRARSTARSASKSPRREPATDSAAVLA